MRKKHASTHVQQICAYTHTPIYRRVCIAYVLYYIVIILRNIRQLGK
jgi:hypothetical protein